MAVNFGPLARILDTGMTGKQSADGFVKIRMQGGKELLEQLRGFVGVLESEAILMNAVEEGAKIIRDDYKRRAQIHGATGNLAKSVDIKKKVYESGVVVAVAGPKHTGNQGASAKNGSGNHSWLLEFGSGPRRPGTQGRRTYVNVHTYQKINRRMSLHGRMNDEDFARAGQGYYFLMGSLRERANQPVARAGYSRDFADGPGPRQHPITLKPGETIAPMPALHPMRETIDSHKMNVYNAVIRVLKNATSAYAA